MQYSFSILFYSNYSNISLSLINALKDCPINLNNIINLNYICIDNEQIRKRILNNPPFL